METEIKYPGWEVVREIGTGSYGKVYEIKKTGSFGTTENSALKVISIPPKNLDIQSYSEEMGLDEESFSAMVKSQMKSITKEFSLMSQLKGNSNIVSYEDHNVVEHDGEPGWDIYIRMELLTPLTNYLRDNNFEKDNPVDESFVVKLGTDICKALTICENHHIVHRDIKPQNIFINKDGNFKLGDFGIAKNAENIATGTRTGTFNYMAPEIYNNQPYGNSVDIYSLGLVMYWLLNERRGPFLPLFPAVPTTSDVDNAMVRRIKGDAIPAPKYGSDTIKSIVLKAIQFDPQKRYISAAEMLKDLTDNYDNGVLKTKPAVTADRSAGKVKMSPINSVKEHGIYGVNNNIKTVAQKKSSKKPIIKKIAAIIAIVAAVVILGVGILIWKVSNTTPYIGTPPEIVPNISMFLGQRETDYTYNTYQNIYVNGQATEISLMPKAIEMKKEYENIIFLTYKDKYEYEYCLYGSAILMGNTLTVSPTEEIDVENAYSVTSSLAYSVSVTYGGEIALKSGDITCYYENHNESSKEKFVLQGSTDGEMFENIKSVNLEYYINEGTEENTGFRKSKCQIVFGDGSYTLDAMVSYYGSGNVSIDWKKTMIPYNGRMELEESYNYVSLYFSDSYPCGFTIIDTSTGKTYSYQNEPLDIIKE